MRNLVVLALVGLAAQLVDGSLGMAYGVTSTTLLLAAGIAPAIASASVHLAEVGTTLASGVSHWRFGNVDWRAAAVLAVPGGVGAFAGATLLSSVSAESAEPYVSAFLLLLGCYILWRFAFNHTEAVVKPRRIPATFLAPLGLIAGFADAAGGGGWGPIGTSSLLASGRIEPRKAIGTIDTSEFVVAVCASIGFLAALGREAIDFAIVGALLGAGVIAAPLAAWLVRKLHARVLGAAAGGLVLITNARTVLGAAGASAAAALSVYALIALVWAVALALAVVTVRRERSAQSYA